MKSTAILCSIACSLCILLASEIYSQTPFITTWQITEANESIEIPTKVDSNYVYDYEVDWGDGNVTSGHTGNTKHTYENAGTYHVSISGLFPAISFGDSDDMNREKIISIDQWGTQEWLTMERAFQGCHNLAGQAVDVPDLSSVRNMAEMFQSCMLFNQFVGNWDVSNVTDMHSMFGCQFSWEINLFNQDIGNWDVSNVTDMSKMFYGAIYFNQDISSWDVSNVTDMNGMFNGSINPFGGSSPHSFNKNIGNWDVSSVTDMSHMFYYAKSFNRDIGNWDVSNVTDMQGMFSVASGFNQDIGNWNVSNVADMSHMFFIAKSFNQNIGNWDVSNVTDMSAMFGSAEAFDQDLRDWDVSNVSNMYYMFAETRVFNQDIGDWDVSNVNNMSYMFHGADVFNQDIGDWDVSSVKNMSEMFDNTGAFNQDIGDWDVSNVTIMDRMFAGARVFNQDIGDWDVSNVNDMRGMFSGNYIGGTVNVENPFNQDIGDWDVSNVSNMYYMFAGATFFNQDIGDWDVSNVTTMYRMFGSAEAFDQDLRDWDVSNVTNMGAMFEEVRLSTENYDSLLIGWSSRNLQSGVEFDGGLSNYCEGESARQSMIDNFGWTIYDRGKDEDCTTSVHPFSESPTRFKIYPNPNSGIIHIPDDFPVEQLKNISALDTVGNKQTLQRLSDKQYQLPKNDGLYFLVFEMKNGQSFTEKVIVLQ